MSTPQTHAPPKAPADDDPARIIRHALDDAKVREDLLSYAGSKVGYRNAIQAEDLVQEAIKRAWERASTYDPRKSSPGLWIHGFLRNIFRENCRTNAKAVTTDTWDAVPDRKWDAERDFDSADARFRVEKYFGKLPPEYQAVVRMKYFDDADGRETAKRLGISYDSARTRLSRAMKMLRELAGADKLEGHS